MASAGKNNEEKEATSSSRVSPNNNQNQNNNGAVEVRPGVQVQGLPLDWTQMNSAAGSSSQPLPVRYPADVAEILPNETEICIVGTAGQKITKIPPEFYKTVSPNLTQLIFRSHLISAMNEGLEFEQLELLELYDNQVQELAGLEKCGTKLKTLDMSYNAIRDMSPVSLCVDLQEVYLANNKLKSMAGLKGLSKLRKLDLGANRIRVMEVDELAGLVNLEELWLGKNKIEHIQGLDKLVKLRRLDVQSNRLTDVENLTAVAQTLEELYLADNAITAEGASKANGLALSFPQLSVLDLSKNRLTTTQPFAHLTSLDELWLSSNKIATFDDVQPVSALSSLDTIYLEYNPVQQDPLYRKRLKEIITSLSQIDATMITAAAAVPSAPGHLAETEEERLRRLQDRVVERARAETKGAATSTSTTSGTK